MKKMRLKRLPALLLAIVLGLSTIQIGVYATEYGENFALNAIVEASEHYQDDNYNLKPENAVDGDLETRWASKNKCAKAWFTLDLTQPEKVDSLIVYEDDALAPNIKEITLQYKTDNVDNWIDVDKSQLSIEDRKIVLKFDRVEAQYFKVDLTTKIPQPGINITEIELRNQLPFIASVEADIEMAGYPAANLIDEDVDSVWKADSNKAVVTLNLTSPRTINTITMDEDRSTTGKISKIIVEIFDGIEWKQEKVVDCSKLPWNKNIFIKPQLASKIRLNLTTDNEGIISVREINIKNNPENEIPTVSDLITLEPDVNPNEDQQTMVDNGYSMFVHFGLNTFTEEEWTYGDIAPSVYAPPEIDADQWVKTVKEAGMKTILLVTKHHDGFCLWDSEYTDYDVGNPESGSHVNVVKAVSDACNKYGINLGIYYSAWDNNWDLRNGKENDVQYNEYMRNQITELLNGDYGLNGKISELWIDGIWEKSADRWEFDKLYDTVKKLQPECQVGLNNTINTGIGAWAGSIPAEEQQEGDNIGYFPSDFRLADGDETRDDDPKLFTHRGQTYYLPFEATLILNKSWFWHTGYGSVPSRSPSSIVQKYKKYGRENNILVLNCGPNREGKIEQADIDSLYAAARILNIASGDALKRPYTEIIEEHKGENLALHGTGHSEQNYEDENFGVDKMLDGDMSTRWASRGGDLESIVEINLDTNKEFNYLIIQEASEFLRTDRIKLEYEKDGNWLELFGELTFDKLGKLELKFDKSISTDKLKLTLTDYEKKGPTISEFQLHHITSVPELTYTVESTNLSIGEKVDIDIVDVKEQVDFEPIMKYYSENEDIATVDENGIVTAKSNGNVNIIAKTIILNEEIEVIIPIKIGSTQSNINKLALQIAIELAEKASLDNVVPAVVAEFNNALANAQAVYDKTTATQEEVDKAFDRLAKVIHKLEFFKGDKKALKDLIDKVKELKESEYTKGTWKTFQDALSTANKVYEDANAMQAEVNQTYSELVKAFVNLRYKPNKDLLKDLINKATGLNAINYSEVSWSRVANALENARAVLDNPEATVEEINSANNVLAKALSGLEEKATGPENTVNLESAKPNIKEAVHTGDNNLIGIYISLGIIGILGTLIYCKRKEV